MWTLGNEVNWAPLESGGDRTYQALYKLIQEVSGFLTKLNRVRTFDAGSTPPEDPWANVIWFDTVNKVLMRYDATGLTWEDDITIPGLAAITASFTAAFHATTGHAHNGTDSPKIPADSFALIDDTVGNVSTAKHGFVPKLPNDATKYLNGLGAWAVPTVPAQRVLVWVCFSGSGTVTIKSDYNVSSITDRGTGDYRVNFETALGHANYAMAGSASKDGTAGVMVCEGDLDRTTSYVYIRIENDESNADDPDFVSIIIAG